jgi:C-terminal processing protease CtpA/Prc
VLRNRFEYQRRTGAVVNRVRLLHFSLQVRLVKQKGELLGIVLVESGWGSMLPTVVLANLMPSGPAARTGRLNIGDQIMSIDGNSLVGLPLSSCQNFVKVSAMQ